MKKTGRIAFLVLALLPLSAHAYIDAGTGAYLVQAILVVVSAAAIFLRSPITMIKKIWRHLFCKERS